MSVHSIKLSRKNILMPSFQKIKCRGVYPEHDEQKDGYALFDGKSFIDTKDSRNYSRDGNFSICLWVRRSEHASTYAICQSHSSAIYASDWIIAGGGALFWMRSKSLGNDSWLNDYKWHHLAFTWNKKNQTYNGYFDGDFLGKSEIVEDYGGMGSIKIGVRGDAISSFWVGSIAHAKIFLRELTDTEVKNIFNMATITSGLGLYYPLSENVRDYSGHNKNGINKGAVFLRGW